MSNILWLFILPQQQPAVMSDALGLKTHNYYSHKFSTYNKIILHTYTKCHSPSTCLLCECNEFVPVNSYVTIFVFL